MILYDESVLGSYHESPLCAGDVAVACTGIILLRRCQHPRRHCRGPVSVHGRPSGPRSDRNWLWSAVSSCHMHYASVLAIVRRLGPGTLLAKMDLANAYRIVPVHTDDHSWLGIQWRGGHIYRHSSAIWTQVCPQDLLSLCRCTLEA